MAADRPTIVLVHGAWADASSFGGVIQALGDRGFTAIGMANPCVSWAARAGGARPPFTGFELGAQVER